MLVNGAGRQTEALGDGGGRQAVGRKAEAGPLAFGQTFDGIG